VTITDDDVTPPRRFATDRPPQLRDHLVRLLAASDPRCVAERARGDERARLARELHDTVAQDLLGIVLHLRVALQAMPPAPPAVRAAMQVALDLAQAGMDDTRRAVGTLRKATGGTIELVSGLKRLVGGAAAWGEPGVWFDCHMTTCRVPTARAEHLLRIAGEAVANAHRHARAAEVVVSLARDGGTTRLTVADDGVGFAPTAPAPGRFGLLGMRERAEEAGCELALRSQPGRGTTVEVRWPTAG
jgi:signal transduction histidine kinase